MIFTGAPYFHDAYKGWTCCQNKSTDFTTFLNTPGCTVGRHSNVKPKVLFRSFLNTTDLVLFIFNASHVQEPEKITGNLTKDSSPEKVIEVRPPIQPPKERPSVESPRQRLTPTIAASLKQALQNIKKREVEDGEDKVKDGDCCKNNGCKQTYPPTSDECKYHPGYPVFHEVKPFTI